MNISIEPILEKSKIEGEPTARESIETKIDEQRNIELELRIKEIQEEENPYKLLTKEKVKKGLSSAAMGVGGALSMMGPETAKLVMMAGAGVGLFKSAKGKIGDIIQQRKDYKEFEKQRLERIEELKKMPAEEELPAPILPTSTVSAGAGLLSEQGGFQADILSEMQRANQLFAEFLDEIRDRKHEERPVGEPVAKLLKKPKSDGKTDQAATKSMFGSLLDFAEAIPGLGMLIGGLRKIPGLGLLKKGAGLIGRAAVPLGGLAMKGLAGLGGLAGGGAMAGLGVAGLAGAVGYGGYKVGSWINKNVLGENLLSKILGVDNEPTSEPKLRKTLVDKLKQKAQKGDVGVLKQAIRLKDQKLITDKEYEEIVDVYNKNISDTTTKDVTTAEQKANQIVGPSETPVAVAGPGPTATAPAAEISGPEVATTSSQVGIVQSPTVEQNLEVLSNIQKNKASLERNYNVNIGNALKKGDVKEARRLGLERDKAVKEFEQKNIAPLREQISAQSKPPGAPRAVAAPTPSSAPAGVGMMGAGISAASATPTVPAVAGPVPDVGEMHATLIGQLQQQGIKDPAAISNIMAQAQAESGFKPKSENLNYSAKTLMRLFGPGNEGGNKVRVRSMEEAQAIASQGPEAVGNLIYGDRMGNAGEGFKYRGRGLIQLTGKDNYTKYGEMLGIDLVNNPDLANDPQIAAKIAGAYYADRGKGKNLADINTVSRLTGHATGAAGNAERARLAQGFMSKLQNDPQLMLASANASTATGASSVPAVDSAPAIQPAIAEPAPVVPSIAPGPSMGTMLASVSDNNASLQTAVTSKQMNSSAMPMPIVAGGGGGGGQSGPMPGPARPNIKPRSEEPYFYEMQKKALISSIV